MLNATWRQTKNGPAQIHGRFTFKSVVMEGYSRTVPVPSVSLARRIEAVRVPGVTGWLRWHTLDIPY